MTDAELISGYLTHAATITRDGTDAECFEAHEELSELVTGDTERAYQIICEIIRRISPEDDDTLAYVAAGPLEDLLARHPRTFIERIENLAHNDAHFRRAVSGVWGWSRIPSDV